MHLHLLVINAAIYRNQKLAGGGAVPCWGYADEFLALQKTYFAGTRFGYVDLDWGGERERIVGIFQTNDAGNSGD